MTLTKNVMTASASAVSIYVNEAYTLNVNAVVLPPAGGTALTLMCSLGAAVVTLTPTSIQWTSASPLNRKFVFSNWLAAGGTTVLSFSIAPGNYPEGYTPPAAVSITVVPLGTWAVTASIVVINGGAAQVVTVTPSAGPTLAKVMTLTPTAVTGVTYTPTFLTWSAGDSAPKTISVTTTSTTSSTNTVTLTLSGTAAYQFVTTAPTFVLSIDGPKTVACTIPKTAIVVGITYTMRCTMTPILPCATCGTATLGYSRTSTTFVGSSSWTSGGPTFYDISVTGNTIDNTLTAATFTPTSIVTPLTLSLMIVSK